MPKLYDDLKETIIKNAKDIIVEKGYCRLSMREVAKRAKIAVGTIYNYFPTKDALVSELMYQYWMEFILAIKQLQEDDHDLFYRLKETYHVLESFIDKFKDCWLKLNGTEKGMAKEHHKQKNQVMDLFLETIEQEIKAYKKQNKIHHENQISDAQLAAFIVQNFMLIAQVKQFDYDTFEKILKSYFL